MGKAALALWFAAMVFLGAGLLARHLLAMPAPRPAVALARPGKWVAVHALYGECRCSQRIADHLETSERPAGWTEIVLWVGTDPPKKLSERFEVRTVTPTELAALGIEAAPSMAVIDPSGTTRYAGGYTERKQGPVIDDVRIMREAQHQDVKALPVFGCAVSNRLQTELSVLPTP